MQQVLTWRLSIGTIFKLVALGFVCSIVPWTLLMGLLAAFGADTLSWDDKPVTGTFALLVSPFIGLFIAAIFSGFAGCAMTVGLWVYSKFRPIWISYIACDPTPPGRTSLGEQA